MKRTLLCCLLTLTSHAEKHPEVAKSATDWQLVWADEFNHKNPQPNPKKWDYEVGFIRNKEAQFYTKNSRKNARVENGQLIIQAHLEPAFKNPNYTGKGDWKTSRKIAQFSSASLTTFQLAGWKYGKIEVRAKLPTGKGVWPAIWMMGINRNVTEKWPRCGEIDIMEYVTTAPNVLHGTVHWANANNKHTSFGKNTRLESPDQFHVYGIEWNENTITWTLDGKKYGTFDLKKADNQPDGNPFHKPFYLILNLAVGGSWGGPVDPSVYPQTYHIDYVRVFQKKTAANR
jgi:beta-glucanase (GH16 family)